MLKLRPEVRVFFVPANKPNYGGRSPTLSWFLSRAFDTYFVGLLGISGDEKRTPLPMSAHVQDILLTQIQLTQIQLAQT